MICMCILVNSHFVKNHSDMILYNNLSFYNGGVTKENKSDEGTMSFGMGCFGLKDWLPSYSSSIHKLLHRRQASFLSSLVWLLPILCGYPSKQEFEGCLLPVPQLPLIFSFVVTTEGFCHFWQPKAFTILTRICTSVLKELIFNAAAGESTHFRETRSWDDTTTKTVINSGSKTRTTADKWVSIVVLDMDRCWYIF
jgi:hypothetical protein